jgi:hypothetical protein
MSGQINLGKPNNDLGISAYNSLRQLFLANQHQHLEIELLPSAIQAPEGQFYLQDDKCIGIPKRLLVLAFQVARSKFMAHGNVNILDRDNDVRRLRRMRNTSDRDVLGCL